MTLTGIRDAATTAHHETLKGQKVVSFPLAAIFSAEVVVVSSETGVYMLKIEFYNKTPMYVPVNPNDQETAVLIFTKAWTDALKER